jgi:hypothetical protein
MMIVIVYAGSTSCAEIGAQAIKAATSVSGRDTATIRFLFCDEFMFPSSKRFKIVCDVRVAARSVAETVEASKQRGKRKKIA